MTLLRMLRTDLDVPLTSRRSCSWAAYYLLAIVVGVLVLLMTLYHKQIINWLKPAAEWMRECVPFPPPLLLPLRVAGALKGCAKRGAGSL